MSDATKLLIGWSSVDVTPNRPVNLYGQFNTRITGKVLDPVTATVLALADAENKAAPDIPFEVHVLRLGDIAFATNSFELFTDFGSRTKARSPATQTFLIQHCGNEELLGGGTYLPTETAEKNKGYSATIYCNIIGHQGGDVLVEATLRMAQALWPQ